MYRILIFFIASFSIFAQQGNYIWFSDEFTYRRDKWVEIYGEWRFQDGSMISVGKVSRILLDLFVVPGSDYSIQVKLAGNGGIMFNIYEYENSHLVGLTGDSLIFGYFDPAGGIKITNAVEIKNSGWNILQVDIFNSKGICDIYLNGERILEAKLFFISGFVGLICMGGSVKFDYIIVFSKRRYIPVDKFRSQKRLVIDHISSISALDGGKLALSSEIYSRVQVIDLNGDLLEQYIYLREARGIFYYNGTIYVCDSDRIRLFSGGRTGMLGQFYLKEPYAIAVESGGYYVIDGNHVKIFNRFFRPVSTFTDPENIKNPTAIAVDGSSIYIADPVLGQVSIFSKVDNKFVGSIKDVFIKPYDVKVDSLGRLLVVDAGLGAIVRVVDSRVDKIYRAESIGGFKFPRAISLIDDRVFIADMDRIVVIDSSLSRIESIITSK